MCTPELQVCTPDLEPCKSEFWKSGVVVRILKPWVFENQENLDLGTDKARFCRGGVSMPVTYIYVYIYMYVEWSGGSMRTNVGSKKVASLPAT